MKNQDTSFLNHPKVLLSLSATELWERFSFYGIKSLLVLFMSASLMQGGFGFSNEYSSAIVGIFSGCLYLAALPGGWLADNYLGQKKAVLYGSIIIAFGHLSIALSIFSHTLFFIGLTLIVIGTGLFKTCISVIVGLLYAKGDSRRDSGFTIFYMGINIGAFIAPLVCGLLQVKYGWHVGFGAGGIGMLFALLIFYFKTIPELEKYTTEIGMDSTWDKPMFYNKNAIYFIIFFIAILIILAFLITQNIIILNPITIAKNMAFMILICTGAYFIYIFFFGNLKSHEKKSLAVFALLFIAASVFWSVYEQQPTSFNFFANSFTDRVVFGFEIPTPWFQSVSALFVILLAPVMAIIWTKLANSNREISSIMKFSLGLLCASLAFFIMALASKEAMKVGLVSPLWLIFSFLFLVIGELCLSPVGLSLMTKIAPNAIRSQAMGLWFVAGALGDVIAGIIGGGVSEENIESLPNLFYECVWILLAVAALMIMVKNPIDKMMQK